MNIANILRDISKESALNKAEKISLRRIAKKIDSLTADLAYASRVSYKQFKNLTAEIDTLKAKSRCYGRCPNGHITVYAVGEKPHCLVADCAGPVYEIVMEIEYAQLQSEIDRLTAELTSIAGYL